MLELPDLYHEHEQPLYITHSPTTNYLDLIFSKKYIHLTFASCVTAFQAYLRHLDHLEYAALSAHDYPRSLAMPWLSDLLHTTRRRIAKSPGGGPPWLLILLVTLWATVAGAMPTSRIAELRKETVDMFYHGYDNYMRVAFPEDEVVSLPLEDDEIAC